MQSVPIDWYKHYNNVLGVGLLFIVGLYFGLPHLDLVSPQSLGIEMYNTAIAGVGALFAFVGFHFFKKHQYQPAALVTLSIATIVISSIIFMGGDFRSPLYFIWLLLLFSSGIFGGILPVVYCVMTILYWIMMLAGTVESSTSTTMGLIYVGANIAAGGLGYIFWRHHYQAKEGDNEKVTALTSKLEAEQLRSEMLINSIADAVVAIDVNGKVQLFNPAAEKMTGWVMKDARNLDANIVMRLMRVEKDTARELKAEEHPLIQSVREGKQINDESTQLHARDDRKYEISLSVSPVIIKGTVQGAVGVFRDVSEQRRQERQRAEFISTASHEMRTPVAAIEGYLALAMNERVSKIDSKARSYIQKAYDSTQQLGALFRDLLTAAKSEDGRLGNHPEVVEMNEFLQKVSDDVRFTAEKKGLQLKYSPAQAGTQENSGQTVVSPLYYVHVDPERIREVVTNLVTNAIKFTEQGGITIGLNGNSDFVQISVRDTGFGIPKDEIPHLFQKFYRVDNSSTRTIGGTGLGLFISRSIVEMYKGRIWVESEVDKGSTFYINLPRLDNQKAQELKKKEEAEAAPVQYTQSL